MTMDEWYLHRLIECRSTIANFVYSTNGIAYNGTMDARLQACMEGL